MRNLVASIQTKLKNIAQKEQKTHHLILVRYFSERLIYRMSLSPYKWKAFLTKMNLHMTIEQNMDFQKVLAVIQQKLYPIFFQLKNER
jgi:hypothetical protein